jgi:hypothetical protein
MCAIDHVIRIENPGWMVHDAYCYACFFVRGQTVIAPQDNALSSVLTASNFRMDVEWTEDRSFSIPSYGPHIKAGHTSKTVMFTNINYTLIIYFN